MNAVLNDILDTLLLSGECRQVSLAKFVVVHIHASAHILIHILQRMTLILPLYIVERDIIHIQVIHTFTGIGQCFPLFTVHILK